MNFEFAKYTEITDFAFKVSPSYRDEGYIRFFICPDVWDFWFVRILEGYNDDYEKEDGCYILERNQIPMSEKGESLTVSKLRRLIEEDDGGNYDYISSHALDDLIETLDGGFGILNLKTQIDD